VTESSQRMLGRCLLLLSTALSLVTKSGSLDLRGASSDSPEDFFGGSGGGATADVVRRGVEGFLVGGVDVLGVVTNGSCQLRRAEGGVTPTPMPAMDPCRGGRAPIDGVISNRLRAGVVGVVR
jgi:hypothetical protein